MDKTAGSPDFTALTAEIVSAYVAKNALRAADIPDLIASVHRALQGLNAPQQVEPEKREPPVPIRKSITPDHLISLEDGRRYKSLKRHLAGRGLTPQAYREKWGLPRDYPMVAPNYAKQRSELAKSLGLGQIRRGRAIGSEPAPEGDGTPEPSKGTRGRRKRTADAA
jgi:predicted transcriptional regulator